MAYMPIERKEVTESVPGTTKKTLTEYDLTLCWGGRTGREAAMTF